jgi:heme A synthase
VDNSAHARQAHRFSTYAWAVVAYNILVILWGAVVRATGSGAGCGEHWPLCQGVVIPHAAQIATLIEFAHRATSGLAVVLVLLLAFLAFRGFGSGHPARRYAVGAVFFTFTEGLIGAALVLAGLVGSRASMMRVFVLSLHLVNTLVLLGALALCAASAAAGLDEGKSIDRARLLPARTSSAAMWYGIALVGAAAVAGTGTIAAMGDTLFHATSLAQGLQWDFTGNSLLRLRVIHPIMALAVAAFLVVLALRALRSGPSPAERRLARGLVLLVVVQLALGPLNLLLLTPLWTQVLHLLAADLIWVTLVLLSAGPLTWLRSRAGIASLRRADDVSPHHEFGAPSPGPPAAEAAPSRRIG